MGKPATSNPPPGGRERSLDRIGHDAARKPAPAFQCDARSAALALMLSFPGGPLLAQEGAPVAVTARLVDQDGVTRLSIDLSRMVEARAFVVDRPDRVIVDLPEVNFQIDPGAGRPQGRGLVKSYRFGLFAPGKSRIVIDLDGPAALRKAGVASIAGGAPSRLLIELARTDRASFHAAVRRDLAFPPEADAGGAPAATAGAPPVVVIDPGHGGVDPGASGPGGVTEKTVVFDFASALAARLTRAGRYTVVMTRSGDTFVSLGDRIKRAREAGAALFISVHADTLSDPDVTGATVYTASDRASDAEAARVAASENRADEAAGLDPTPDNPNVSDILFELTRRETRTYAHLYQRTLVGYWRKIARLNKNPERAAGFKVLQAPDVPSVLLELGYLSSQRDSLMLTSPEWRAKAAETVAQSVDAFFAQRRALDGAAGTAAPPPPGDVVSLRSHL